MYLVNIYFSVCENGGKTYVCVCVCLFVCASMSACLYIGSKRIRYELRLVNFRVCQS